MDAEAEDVVGAFEPPLAMATPPGKPEAPWPDEGEEDEDTEGEDDGA